MDNIILYNQNAQSLTNKMDELSIILHNNYIDPHLVCFSEHHLKDSEISQISFNGYTLPAGYSRENSPGGGVCIFTKNDLIYQNIDISKYCCEKLLEICDIRYQLKSLKLIISRIYKPPI
jgi:hypothetical protein